MTDRGHVRGLLPIKRPQSEPDAVPAEVAHTPKRLELPGVNALSFRFKNRKRGAHLLVRILPAEESKNFTSPMWAWHKNVRLEAGGHHAHCTWGRESGSDHARAGDG